MPLDLAGPLTNLLRRLDSLSFSHLFRKFEYIYEDIPRTEITFIETPYTSDVWLREAFRHEILVPDEMYPQSWRKGNKRIRKRQTATTLAPSEETEVFKKKMRSFKHETLEAIREKQNEEL